MEIIISEEQSIALKAKLIFEGRNLETCNVLSDKYQKKFCVSAEKYVKGNLKTFESKMDDFLSNFFVKKDNIENINFEKLGPESERVKSGFLQMDEVSNLLRDNCNLVVGKLDKLKEKYLKKFKMALSPATGAKET